MLFRSSQVELVIDSEGKIVPALYISKGKYKLVEYSANNGTAYVRKNGKISLSETEIVGIPACESAYEINIPLKVVLYKKKDKLPIDCSYTEDLLAEAVLFQFNSKQKDLKKAVGAMRSNILVKQIDTDSANVWKEETDNLESVDVNYDIACIGIEIDLILISNKNCFKDICYTEEIGN